MATIESKDETVLGVFGSFYVVPNYQREYVWCDVEVEQLLRDIRTEQLDNEDAEYFIGSIVVCPRTDGALDLIDGQQRTTTVFIVLCANRDRLRALGETGTTGLDKLIADTRSGAGGRDVHRARVDPQYEDAGDVFRGLVAGDRPGFRGTRSMRNVAAAYAAAERFLLDEVGSATEAVFGFYAYLINRVKLIRIKTDSLARALKIFETINDRGVGLDAMDLLKNLLFMRADRDDFERLRDRWKALTDALHARGEKPLRFLRYYVFATYGVTKLREDELYAWLQRNEARVGYGTDPIGFVTKLQDALSAYLNFLAGRGRHGEPHPAVEAVAALAGGATRQHLILLLAGRDLLDAVFDALCRDTEALLLAYLITRQNNREFEALFPTWAIELSAIRDLAGYEEFARTTIRARRQELAIRFRREFVALDVGTLRQYQTRYLLPRLTQHVALLAYGERSQGHVWLSRYMDAASFEIEHILPQTPDRNTLEEFGLGTDDPLLLRSPGNLALVEKSINASLGNRGYAHKRAVYPQSQLLLTRAIAAKPEIGRTAIDRAVSRLEPFETWTADAVTRRAEMLADLEPDRKLS